MSDIVKLIECFRNTFQGEGIDSGQRFTLLRGKYCNKNCSFCDTKIKMRISQEAEYKISDIQTVLNEERTALMISGGEPTIPRHFNDTLTLLNDLTYPLANVETNGFQLKELIEKVDPTKPIHYMYSPKIFSDIDLITEMDNTRDLINNPNVFIKLVYEKRSLVTEYIKWLSELSKEYNPNKVWIMPEGDTREKLIENSPQVFDICEQHKFNFSSRDHIIYGFI